MVVGLLVAVLLLRIMFRQLHQFIVVKTAGLGIRYTRKWFILSACGLCILVYGSFTIEPLRWNAAFQSNDSFDSYLALNPMQNFFTTLKFRALEYNAKKTLQSFGIIAPILGIPQGQLSYNRSIAASQLLPKNPNIILVLCESFSMYKSSMSGNPLNTTPFFKSLCDSGIFFNHCFTPHFSTARGLFATLTGIPDVQLSKFSTRNPDALDQHIIINHFADYNKFYFLGGNPSFNNFEGLVQNIKGVKMNTGLEFADKPLNVWGISDKDLFEKANFIFSQQTKPFFALIQTADNHRPFNLPEGEKDFKTSNFPDSVLKFYGFESQQEYKAFRYTDYCFQQFILKAKQEKYFDNTLFVFVGDHGVAGNAKNIYPGLWTNERLTEEHVPLLFYAPKLLQPEKKEETVSQIDVLPSIAGISGQRYTNTTLGRDVLQPATPQEHMAFVIHHDEGRIGIITDKYFFTKNLNFEREYLYDLKSGGAVKTQSLDSLKNALSHLTTAYYETAKWMLVHNHKKD
ncbi:MAG: hypothetical protein NVS1B13_05380 [Flavisolibacter sp.]